MAGIEKKSGLRVCLELKGRGSRTATHHTTSASFVAMKYEACLVNVFHTIGYRYSLVSILNRTLAQIQMRQALQQGGLPSRNQHLSIVFYSLKTSKHLPYATPRSQDKYIPLIHRKARIFEYILFRRPRPWARNVFDDENRRARRYRI